MTTDQAYLERRAASGDPEAELALGRLFEVRADQQAARGWFARAAQRGNATALRLLAMNLLTQEPIVASEGVKFIRMAADRGDAAALYVCAAIAAGDTNLAQRFDVARDYLERAAKAGSQPAQQELALLAAGGMAETPDMPVQTVFDDPRVQVIEKFAPREVCDWLIGQTRSRLHKAKVYDAATGGGTEEGERSNSSAEFTIPESSVQLGLIRARAAAIAGLPMKGLEKVSILHYAVGQEFVPHSDYLDPAVPAYAREIAQRGQRAATFLLYLNDDYDGGETNFLDMNWRYKGKTGDALLFWNIDAQGGPHPRSHHAGTPTTRGEKWVLSQWMRLPPR